ARGESVDDHGRPLQLAGADDEAARLGESSVFVEPGEEARAASRPSVPLTKKAGDPTAAIGLSYSVARYRADDAVLLTYTRATHRQSQRGPGTGQNRRELSCLQHVRFRSGA